MGTPTYRKTLEYPKIQENLQSENLTGCYICKENLSMFSLPWKILYKCKMQ